MKVSDSPVKDKCPEEIQEQVMHSSIINDSIILFATDMVPEGKFTEGTGMALNLNCSVEEINNYFDKLSHGGKIIHPLKEEFWGGIFGVLVDKFGKKWMLHAEKK